MKFDDLVKNPLSALTVGGVIAASLWGCGSKDEPVFSVGAGDVEKMQRNYDSAKTMGVSETELEKRVAFDLPIGSSIKEIGSIETLEITRPVGEVVDPDGNLPEDMNRDEPWTVQNGGFLVGKVIEISWSANHQPHRIFAYIPEAPAANATKYYASLGREDMTKLVGRLDDPYTNTRFVADRSVYSDPSDAPEGASGKLLRIEDVRSRSN